jgi:hypothetical protein
MLFDGDSTPNMPVLELYEAMLKDVHISMGYKTLEVLSYYCLNGRMYLDVQERESK